MPSERTLSARPRPAKAEPEPKAEARPEEKAVPKSAKGQSLQDGFLNLLRKSKSPVTMFLVNGVMLQGDIVAFDLFCMLLERERQVQLVYKHAISTVQPNGPINLTDNGEADGDA